MQFISLLISALFVFTAYSEPGSQEEAAIRQMQAQAEQQRMDEEFKNPKKVPIEKDRAVRGNLKAPIMLVEYSDFQCPFCQKGFETVEQIRQKYGKKIVFIFKHMPLDFHPMALPAAKRFEAIAMQNKAKAYEFHDQVFKNQQHITEGESFLDNIAQGLKINMKKYKTDIDSPTVMKHIEADKAEAASLGIRGTPGFLVSGVTIKGAYPAETFYAIIDKRLAEKTGKKEAGAR